MSQPSEGDGATSEPASIDRLLEMMDRGDFDLVAVGRALIANPDWPKVLRSGGTADLQPYNKDLLAELTCQAKKFCLYWRLSLGCHRSTSQYD